MTGLLALSLTAFPTTVPAAAAPCARAAAVKAGRWFSANPPRESPHLHNVVALDPANPLGLFVSDGVRVFRSNDGGCTWSEVYALPDLPGAVPDRQRGAITSIDVARVAGKTRVLLAVGDAPSVTMTRTVLVRSDDGYRDWAPVFDSLVAGLPVVDGWASVVRSAGAIAYAAVPAGHRGVAYARSGDGGRTWTVRTPLAGWGEFTAVAGFAVNPWRPDELWDWRAATLRRSTDGGTSWTEVDAWPTYETDPLWYSADIAWPRRGGPARVLILGDNAVSRNPSVNTPLGTWSGDGGRTFRLVLPPSVGAGLRDALVAHLGSGEVVVLATNRRAWRIPHLGRPPRGSEWRALQRPPYRGCFVTVPPCNADGSAGRPGVVAMPTGLNLQLLQVAR